MAKNIYDPLMNFQLRPYRESLILFGPAISKKPFNYLRGFTLIELLLVVAISALISSAIFVNVTGAKKRGSVATGLKFSQTVNNSLGAYSVGIWDFNEGSGATAQDRSGYGNHGTITGATYISDTPLHVIGEGTGQWALRFDAGDETAIIYPSGVDLGSTWTIEAWFKTPLDNTGNYHTLTRGLDGDHQIIVHFNQVDLGSYNNTLNVFVDSGFDMNTLAAGWHHIAAVGAGGSTTFFIDGRDEGSIPWQSLTDVYCIGNYQLGGQYFGAIDEVRVYEQALSIGEIQKHYAEGAARHSITLK